MTGLDPLAVLDALTAGTTPGPWTVEAAAWSAPIYADGVCVASAALGGDASLLAAAPALVSALRAVLDLHRPTPERGGEICETCSALSDGYLVSPPCDAVCAITDAFRSAGLDVPRVEGGTP